MPLRVLIVEDEHLIALDLRDILEGAGHTVVGHATNQAEALKLAKRGKPDVAMMDMDLQDGGSGLDAAAALGSKFQVPVLFLTGDSGFLVRAMALPIEPLGYVSKPYQPAEILDALHAFKV